MALHSSETIGVFNINVTHPMPPTISHPADRGGMYSESHSTLNEKQRDNLEMRFGSNFGPIESALEIASLWDIKERQHKELSTIFHILGYSENPATDAEQYNRLAGDTKNIPQFLQFFSRISERVLSGSVETRPTSGNPILDAHFAQLDLGRKSEEPSNGTNSNMGKMALEIAGTIQKGDWDGTSQLDGIFRQLKITLEQMPESQFECLERPGQQRPTYRYHSIPMEDGGDHDFGLIHRRRKVANAFGVGIFKQSHGLVVVEHLPRELREQAHRVEYGTVDRNSVAARIGRQFEEEIRAEKGSSRAIVPTSAHYLAITKR